MSGSCRAPTRLVLARLRAPVASRCETGSMNARVMVEIYLLNTMPRSKLGPVSSLRATILRRVLRGRLCSTAGLRRDTGGWRIGGGERGNSTPVR